MALLVWRQSQLYRLRTVASRAGARKQRWWARTEPARERTARGANRVSAGGERV